MGWRTLDQTTDTPLATSENAITHYSVEADFEIDNLSAGIIFASNAEHSHYYMWQVNLEAGYPPFPHLARPRPRGRDLPGRDRPSPVHRRATA